MAELQGAARLLRRTMDGRQLYGSPANLHILGCGHETPQPPRSCPTRQVMIDIASREIEDEKAAADNASDGGKGYRATLGDW